MGSIATRAQRVQRRRDKLRAAGLRPIQIWVPDTRAPGFAEECARQCAVISAAEESTAGRAEAEFWDTFIAEAWADLDPPE